MKKLNSKQLAFVCSVVMGLIFILLPLTINGVVIFVKDYIRERKNIEEQEKYLREEQEKSEKEQKEQEEKEKQDELYRKYDLEKNVYLVQRNGNTFYATSVEDIINENNTKVEKYSCGEICNIKSTDKYSFFNIQNEIYYFYDGLSDLIKLGNSIKKYEITYKDNITFTNYILDDGQYLYILRDSKDKILDIDLGYENDIIKLAYDDDMTILFNKLSFDRCEFVLAYTSTLQRLTSKSYLKFEKVNFKNSELLDILFDDTSLTLVIRNIVENKSYKYKYSIKNTLLISVEEVENGN